MMRRRLFPIAAVMPMVLVVGAAAQEACTPVEPKKWEGTILLSGGWVGSTIFTQAGCTWGPAEALNGIDTIVWDVGGYGGLPASILSKTTADFYYGVVGSFYNESCERVGFFGITRTNVPYALTIPTEARWMVVVQDYGGVNTEVTMESPGRQCEEVVTPTPTPKKKKKPRN